MITILPIAALNAWHIVLWVVLVVVFVGSLFGLRTRWARQRPILRCVLLSLAAHAVLIGLAAFVRFAAIPPGAGKDESVRVTIIASKLQPSILAEETPAATDELAEEPTEEPIAPVVEPDAEEAPPEPEPISEADPEAPTEPIQPPDLMPPPDIAEQGEEIAEVMETPPAVEPETPPETPAPETPPSEPNPPAEVTPAVPEAPTPAVADITPATPAVPSSYAERIRPDRSKSILEQGGSLETENAVGRALEWLAQAQARDGRWDADQWRAGRELRVLGHDRHGAGVQADTGITGLALLTFMGSGHSHLGGPYQHQIAGGLVFLMRSQTADGCLAGDATFYARTYCHSMATFALAEAYAMTGDKRLEASVRRGVDYLLRTENKTYGGWRYEPNTVGDVSQLGWIIMALRSAEMAGIDIPNETWQRIEYFLSRVVRGRNGGLAAYRPNTDWSRSMTAEAMYCRQVLGKPLTDLAQLESLDALAAELPGDGMTNYYYWYYAGLALHHAQHDGNAARLTWNRWNERMKHQLLTAQVIEGSDQGSWNPNTVWGGYGGRVYTTAMAAMCLEVYYRYGSPAAGQSPWIATRPRGETTQK
ncbi:prenyltransferase/squalene oxidase repeat-containing protein [Aeoliella mucimassa]|uniref:Prenyltransferase and squalene oxidase repeat protein n=1 Tax=Aeoliella mucimassa TaxID=2527972 RepID=A0A518AN92_9BACT|nr:prenyltransferase/squalene oxidase repeat-containing protein [Aeoliella mucimassa]QDU56199.1 hypothetical protein Pan181_24060 [Aeoliella mucimassa]